MPDGQLHDTEDFYPFQKDNTDPATPDRSSSDYPMPENWQSGGGDSFNVVRAMDDKRLDIIGEGRVNPHVVE